MITKIPISLQREIKETYKKESELLENNSFMGKVIGINIETQNGITTLQILTEHGISASWVVEYSEIELNELERYLFGEIPLFKNGAVIEEMEILTISKY